MNNRLLIDDFGLLAHRNPTPRELAAFAKISNSAELDSEPFGRSVKHEVRLAAMATLDVILGNTDPEVAISKCSWLKHVS